jgi:SWI/SNF-related matrix-associated actin-dependent regulator 1 of chromatin subfamily A
LAPLVLRRVKAEVLVHLAPKTEQVVMLDMLPEQRSAYASLYEKLRSGGGSSMHTFSELRKVANHSLLGRTRYVGEEVKVITRQVHRSQWFGETASLEQVEKELAQYSDFEMSSLMRQVGLDAKAIAFEVCARSCKCEYLCANLPVMVSQGHFVIVFSQWTIILDVLEVVLDKVLNLAFLRLDGSTPVGERQIMVDEFNAGAVPVFLLSTKAGGLGLNLTKADTVILHDLDWSVSNDTQAEDRAHRIGQKNPVSVFKLVTKGTVDEGIFRVAESKRGLDKLAVSDLSSGDELLPKIPMELAIATNGSSGNETPTDLAAAALGWGGAREM